MTEAWKPTFSKINLEQLKNQRARSLCSKINKPDESLEAWPLAIKKVDPIYPVPETLREKYIEAEVVEPEHAFQPILPELWQNWMAKEIMEHEVIKEHMDYLEAMERRDKITKALIVLRSEAAALNMQDVLTKISTAGANLLDELWNIGGLGD
jgi:hypothetical protein